MDIGSILISVGVGFLVVVSLIFFGKYLYEEIRTHKITMTIADQEFIFSSRHPLKIKNAYQKIFVDGNVLLNFKIELYQLGHFGTYSVFFAVDTDKDFLVVQKSGCHIEDTLHVGTYKLVYNFKTNEIDFKFLKPKGEKSARS